jgi:uncharacterized membrane protein
MSTDADTQATGAGSSPMVGWTRRLEQASSLDRPAQMLQPVADALVAQQARRDLLHGTWLGHAVHPVLTDVVIGFWTSANVLDLVGGAQSRIAAQRLVGLGLAAALPTAVTGLSEWAVTEQREQRVGLVHASANTIALTLYAGSWRARRADRHGLGTALGLAGSAAAAVGGYLGGHLVSARKVSSRNPTFQDGPAETL